MQHRELATILDQLLDISRFRDYAPNGLQVEGRAQVNNIITGVSANQALIDAAVAANADAILVHHGFFWKGENPCIVGHQYQRLKTLLSHDINLYAYHLPLDYHQELGNNALFAKAMGFETIGQFSAGEQPGVGYYGKTAEITALALAQKLEKLLLRQPLHIASTSQQNIRQVAWCTGAAQDHIIAAKNLGMDAFITGEVSERTFALAKELDIHFYAAGHHATERFGIKALGEYLSHHYQLTVQLVDIDNPI